MPTRPRRPGLGDERLPLDEAVGQYLLNQPIVRSVREHPEIAAPWIVLGVATALAALVAGGFAALPLLVIGFYALRWARGYVPRRQDGSSSGPMGGWRQALIVGWVAAMAALIVIITIFEGATGYTGIVTVIGLLLALPIAGTALYLILRA